MKLNTANVSKIFKSCLFKDDELNEENMPTSPVVKVEAVASTFGFHQERLGAIKPKVMELLSQMPEAFFKDIGQGDTFLNGLVNDKNIPWSTNQSDLDMLLALGLGTELITYSMPRDMWPILPSGLPYFTINCGKLDVAAIEAEELKANAPTPKPVEKVKVEEVKEASTDDKIGTFTQIAIKEAIAKYPERSQTIIELSYFQGKSSAEIAEELGSNKGAATRIVNKFKKELAIILEKDLDK